MEQTHYCDERALTPWHEIEPGVWRVYVDAPPRRVELSVEGGWWIATCDGGALGAPVVSAHAALRKLSRAVGGTPTMAWSILGLPAPPGT